jgi:amidase
MSWLEAYFLPTQCGRARLGNMVGPKYTLGASTTKETVEKIAA